jgi:hypothetical protein
MVHGCPDTLLAMQMQGKGFLPPKTLDIETMVPA